MEWNPPWIRLNQIPRAPETVGSTLSFLRMGCPWIRSLMLLREDGGSGQLPEHPKDGVSLDQIRSLTPGSPFQGVNPSLQGVNPSLQGSP